MQQKELGWQWSIWSKRLENSLILCYLNYTVFSHNIQYTLCAVLWRHIAKPYANACKHGARAIARAPCLHALANVLLQLNNINLSPIVTSLSAINRFYVTIARITSIVVDFFLLLYNCCWFVFNKTCFCCVFFGGFGNGDDMVILWFKSVRR